MKSASLAFLLFLSGNDASAFTVPSIAAKTSTSELKMAEEHGSRLAFQDKLGTYPVQSLSNTNSQQLTAIHREQRRIPNARQISTVLPPSENTPPDNRSQLTRRASPQDELNASLIPPAHQEMLSPYSKWSLANTDSQTISGCIRRGGRFRARG